MIFLVYICALGAVMLLISVIYSEILWILPFIGSLSIDFETAFFEFIMLGRIPATEIYLQFEFIIALVISIVLAVMLKTIFTNPVQTHKA
jgi:hypothetical protein